MKHGGRDPRAGRAGFSLVELVVVVGIMMILAAMTMPAITRYFRLYRIRGALQQVSGAVQTARHRAVTKNVNFGVDFVTESPTRYWVHYVDDQSAAHSRSAQDLDFSAPQPSQSILATLPEGVRFAASAAECPTATLAMLGLTGTAATFAPNGSWFRFTRLGNRCVSGANCTTPHIVGTPATVVMNVPSTDPTLNGSSVVCLFQPATGLSRALVVSPGGRVRTPQ